MSQPNPNTAIILNSILLQLRVAEQEIEFQDANVEFAMGIPVETRDDAVDLCWGLAPITSRSTTDLHKHLIISPGLVKYDGVIREPLTTQTAFDFADILDEANGVIIEEAYAFGSIYVSFDTNTTSFGLTTTLVGQDTVALNAGPVHLVLKDYDIEAAQDLFASNIITPVIPYHDEEDYVDFELLRFVLDIQYYDPLDSSRNVIKAHVIDIRKPRGFGGFAEEVLATMVTPNLILSKRFNTDLMKKAFASYKNLVTAWVLLTSWEPNFIAYWTANPELMPAELKDYLFTELGVLLP